MGKSRSFRPRKRKFYGNQNTPVPDISSSEQSQTASSLKLQMGNKVSPEGDSEIKSLHGTRMIDLQILIGVFSLLCCPQCLNIGLFLVEDSRFGLASNFSVCCKNCDFVSGFCSSKRNNKLHEINARFVYGLRLIGRGLSAGRKLCAILNLPPFLSKLAFRLQEKKLLTSAATVAQNVMNAAAQEVRGLNKSANAIVNCGVSVDGTWQRRGYSSLNGCVSAISIDTGKVLDFETLSRSCRLCTSKTLNREHHCKRHKGSSANMEPVGAYRIFERSQNLRMLRYTDFYGDGDSKAFDKVKDIYGKDSVSKLECIGHIQKRVGTRLRKLKSTKKGLGGKGKLTDNLINKLQNYYGIAIRSNVGDLLKMQSAVIAAFFHCCALKHGQCPIGPDSWCKFKRAEALKKVYNEKSTPLPQNIINIIRPCYEDLCDQNLLKKCLHGKTQNPNECFNGILWQIVPKDVFVELQTLHLGGCIAVVQFNGGFQGLLSILNEMGIDSGNYTVQGQVLFDNERIADSKRHSLPTAKITRRKLRAIRKKRNIKIEEEEGILYKTGEF